MSLSPEHATADYPLQLDMKGHSITIREMNAGDGPAMLAFARSLPAHDILFMRRNITEERGIEKWIRSIESGINHSVIALKGEDIVSYSTIHMTELDWSSHVAELRVSVSTECRNMGLGRTLVREAFKLAVTLDIEIIVYRMTPDQTSARALFEELGFRNEAVLKDHMKDSHGDYHDLLVMAVNVNDFLARKQAFGTL